MAWRYYLFCAAGFGWSLKLVLCQKAETARNAENLQSCGTADRQVTEDNKSFRMQEYSDVLKRGHNAQRHSHGFWMGVDTADLHDNFTDSAFQRNLPRFFQAEPNVRSVIDVGCGNGGYAKALADAGFLVNCYDGNPQTQEVSGGRCAVLDFSRPVNLLFKYDWVISIKVGKHVPAKYQDTFINNLDLLNTEGIMMCWGGNTKEESGQYHFNHKTDKEVVEIFEKKGYVHDLEGERRLKAFSSTPTLKQRLLLFRKKTRNTNK